MGDGEDQAADQQRNVSEDSADDERGERAPDHRAREDHAGEVEGGAARRRCARRGRRDRHTEIVAARAAAR
ncbi:hypothetical protein GCM10010231_58150 [Streptomyces sindenensis]|nr:hypothetical protein GCM10010231_58150 [Streptomyces sindenensis]